MIRLKKNINKRSLQVLEVLGPCHSFVPFQWKYRGVGYAGAVFSGGNGGETGFIGGLNPVNRRSGSLWLRFHPARRRIPGDRAGAALKPEYTTAHLVNYLALS